MLDNDILYLKGVGPQRAEALKSELRIATRGDLLEYYPFRYIDRSQIIRISDIASDAAAVQLMGEIISMKEMGEGKARRLTALFMMKAAKSNSFGSKQ